jgi:hypothetical protein
MKALLALALSAFSFAALAMPKVGDMATYAIQTQGISFTSKSELTKFDVRTSKFTRVDTTIIFGNEEREEELVDLEDLSTADELNMMLAFCETNQINGKRETITVRAGTFNTCAVTTQDGVKVNLGVVPFGVVRARGNDLALELIDFRLGR